MAVSSFFLFFFYFFLVSWDYIFICNVCDVLAMIKHAQYTYICIRYIMTSLSQLKYIIAITNYKITLPIDRSIDLSIGQKINASMNGLFSLFRVFFSIILCSSSYWWIRVIKLVDNSYKQHSKIKYRWVWNAYQN